MDKGSGNNSVTDLFGELISHYAKRATLSHDNPKVRQLFRTFLKRKVYNKLFETIDGPLKRTPGRLDSPTDSVIRQRMLQAVFDLRMRRKFDAADRLETRSGDIVREADGSSEMTSILHFLLSLANTSTENTVPLIGKGISLPQLSGEVFLPAGPLNYGDTRYVSHNNLHFTQFPKETFDSLSRPLSGLDVTEGERHLMESVAALPGSGIYRMLQTTSSRLPTSSSDGCLMGALSQLGERSTNSNFVRLELPDLQEHGAVGFRPRRFSVRQSNEASEDEGFNESSLAPSCSLTPGGPHTDSSFWDPLHLAVEELSHPRPVKFTWESRGHARGFDDADLESGYMSEAGSLASDCALALKRHHLSSLRPEDTPAPIVVPNLNQDGAQRPSFATDLYRRVVEDTMNLLIGLPSATFHFDNINLRFEAVSGSGPDDFLVRCGAQLGLRTGSHIARLRALVLIPWTDPVMRAFAAALNSHLNAYRACIIALSQMRPRITFLELGRQVRGLCQQIEHLVHLCNLSVDGDDIDLHSCVPHGIELLAYLFQRAQEYTGSHVGVVMLALFREACRPFVQFLNDWAFTGMCRGRTDDFLIRSNDIFLSSRDKKFWCNAYELRGMRCYLLPETLMNDVFRCGKSLNLLRRIAPKHHIFSTGGGGIPRLTLTLSPRATEWQLAAVESYVSRMEQLSWQRQATRQQVHLREELAKQELIRLAKETTLQELERLRRRAFEVATAVEARKRAELAELRREAEMAVERRRQEKEAEKESNKRYIQEVMQREQELRQYSQDAERRARDELVAYYSRLTADAAFRELRALWRLERRKLDPVRREFLMRDAARWRQAMERHRESLSPQVSILSVADPSLSFLRSTSMLEESQVNNSAVDVQAATPRSRWSLPRPPSDLPVAEATLEPTSPPPVPPKPRRATWNKNAAVPVLLGAGEIEERRQADAEASEASVDEQEVATASPRDQEVAATTPPDLAVTAGPRDEVTERQRDEVASGRSAQEQEGRQQPGRTRTHPYRSAVQETDWDAEEERERQRLSRFRERNRHGHASHSTVQRLLYGGELGERGHLDEAEEEEAVPKDWSLASGSYRDAFRMTLEEVNGRPCPHILSRRAAVETPHPEEEAQQEEEEEGSLLPLPVIMRKALVKPLVAQIRLVNELVLNHFLVELQIRDFFTSLRHFFLLEDGEFGDSLCQLLFPKMASRKLDNLSFLNQLLSAALQQSRFGTAVLADKLSFALRTGPSALGTGDGGSESALDGLGLVCTVEWPVNVVVTENSLSKYNKIFTYLLQMKHAVWAVADIHFKLRRDALVHPSLHTSEQMRRLHLCRHNMEHLLKVLEVYICQQVSQVTWDELEKDLQDRCHHLDDLRRVHAEYLNRGLHRCLLTPKLRPLMRVVLGAFAHVHRFRRLLLVHPWECPGGGRAPHHPNYERLLSTHATFREHALFLHRVMSKLVRRGARQRHLEQFLLLLDFNRHFSSSL